MTPPFDEDALIGHAGFVRKLARQLVACEVEAQDLEQETWLAALRRPPQRTGEVRGWLATVMRNIVRQRQRSRIRRARREEASARDETVASGVAKALDRERLILCVVPALQELPEEQRTAIVLRYYEGLPLIEVAEAAAVSEEAVRSRIRRGIERMRGVLDRQSDGDRQAWALPLISMVGQFPTKAMTSAGSAGVASGVLYGGLAMTIKSKLTACAGLLAIGLVILSASSMLSDQTEDEVGITDTGSTLEPRSSEDDSASVRKGGRLQTSPYAGESTPASRARLQGIVVDRGTKKPIEEAIVIVSAVEGDWSREVVSDAAGRFSFRGLPAEIVAVQVTAPGLLPHQGRRKLVDDALREIVVELSEGRMIRGIVEDERENPVAGATVSAGGRSTRSDARGRFTMRGLAQAAHTVRAEARGYLEGMATANLRGSRHESSVSIKMRRGGGFFGRVTNEAGAPLEGVSVEVYLEFTDLPAERLTAERLQTATDAEGRYEISGVATQAGDFVHVLRFVKTGYAAEFSPRIALNEDERSEVSVALDSTGARVRGLVVDSDGNPISGADVTLHCLTSGGWDPKSGGRGLARELETERNGGFEFSRVSTGRYRLAASAPDYATIHAPEFEVSRGKPLEDVKIVLPSSSKLAGTVSCEGKPIEGATIRVWSEQCSAVTTSQIDGRFETPALPAGPVEVEVMAEGYGHATRGLPKESADAGALTTGYGRVRMKRVIPVKGDLDISFERLEVLVQGVVTDQRTGTPLQGCRVDIILGFFPIHSATTAADGSFSMLENGVRHLLSKWKKDTFKIKVTRSGYWDWEQEGVYRDLLGSSDPLLIRMSSPGFVEGWVRNDRGNPVEGANVYHETGMGSEKADLKWIGVTESDGYFCVEAPTREGLRFAAQKDWRSSYATQRVDVWSGEVSQVYLWLPPPTHLEINLVGEDGKPLQSAEGDWHVDVRGLGQDAIHLEFLPGGKGRFTTYYQYKVASGRGNRAFLRELPEGQFEVSLRKPGFASSPRRVFLQAGREVRIEWTLTPSAASRGR